MAPVARRWWTLHGWHKVVEGWNLRNDRCGPAAGARHRRVGIPVSAVFAAIAAISRFAGGWLLAFGAFTRIAACLIVTTTVTALGFNMQASAW
ncbi:MAG: DoxX family protein [Burkholderiales bacterium]